MVIGSTSERLEGKSMLQDVVRDVYWRVKNKSEILDFPKRHIIPARYAYAYLMVWSIKYILLTWLINFRTPVSCPTAGFEPAT
jgi:hypothetical protein